MSHALLIDDRPAAADRSADSYHPDAAADTDGIELIEIPDDVDGDLTAGTCPPGADGFLAGGGFLAAHARRGFAAGRRRGFREAVALTSLAVEELIADRALGDVPPSVLRQLAAALTARLAGHAPPEPFLEGGLGI